MHRRDFLRLSASASAGLALPGVARSARLAGSTSDDWRMFEVTTRVEILDPAGVTRVWLPVPLTQDRPFFKALGNAFDAQGGTTRYAVDGRYGAGMVYGEWADGVKPVLELKSRFATRDIAVDLSRPWNPHPESIATLAHYTAATQVLPTDGIVRDVSDEAVKGAKGDVEKAHAIYEWIVENTTRNPETRGCGTGDMKFMLENRLYSGKCADLNSLFVALARAQGIPARDVFGVRVADSRLGYKSLGKSGDITKAQHCRAEFYSAEHGWVPVDPADVRKVILEEGGGKPIDDPKVVAARKRLFGTWEMNWLAYNYANDVALPGSTRPPIHFLMYPQSETAAGPPRRARSRPLQLPDRLAGDRLIAGRGVRAAVRALLAAALFAFAAAHAAEGPLRAWEGKPTPALKLRDLAGREVDLAALGGKVVLVNFWATWCAPCVAELPSIERLAKREAGKPFEALAVNYGESQAKVAAFVRKRHLDLHVLLDPESAAGDAWGAKGLPMTFLVDARGKVRFWTFGEREWDQGQALQTIEALLGEAAGARR